MPGKRQVGCRFLYEALKARGKPPKVALIASMRKLLVVLNARLRDERLAATTAPSRQTLKTVAGYFSFGQAKEK
ncbi:hypothetical protein EAH75_19355 [Rhodanobacter glycinis]|uniref:Uncharacterized protein n=1 Tax=Rhodanobacter glycinis TaxID=582702 RepID=A0A502F3X9_9GAMM|nr:hypothetical protein EAH88_09645 [Rhodanobacter glycinis]TPG44855.1 hypothetical protein EAH75_19355 [Rhodanobacter glycinis]